MGQRDGSGFRARAAEGIAAYYMGYGPSYLLARVFLVACPPGRDCARHDLGVVNSAGEAANAVVQTRPSAHMSGGSNRPGIWHADCGRCAVGPARPPCVDVLVVCSAGGHLFDAYAIAPAWSERTSAWVSFDKADVRVILAEEHVYFGHGPTNRNIPNLIRNLALAWRVIGETRPRVLVTTGAGIAVPFAWVARVRGAWVIYVECAGRIDKPSLSGRLTAPVADRIYAQSGARRQMEASPLRRQRVALTANSVSHGAGLWVFVTVGTNEAPFDRLVGAATRLTGEPVIVQHGPSKSGPMGRIASTTCRSRNSTPSCPRLAWSSPTPGSVP